MLVVSLPCLQGDAYLMLEQYREAESAYLEGLGQDPMDEELQQKLRELKGVTSTLRCALPKRYGASWSSWWSTEHSCWLSKTSCIVVRLVQAPCSGHPPPLSPCSLSSAARAHTRTRDVSLRTHSTPPLPLGGVAASAIVRQTD